MDNIIRQTTELAMHIVRAYVEPGDVVIDATCGNGKDTLALAAMNPRSLYAFDIQEKAVRETVSLLEANGYGVCKGTPTCKGSPSGPQITVEQLAHENLRGYFEDRSTGCVKAVVFNLGYLPGGDRSLTTKAETTLEAVRGAMDLITKDGLVCITMYSGHPEGRKEKAALLEFAEGLDDRKWHCAFISMPNQKKDPPEILLITKK
ncbi:MAG: class I SAM-dependent methyltransferase [Bacillota bacterium]